MEELNLCPFCGEAEHLRVLRSGKRKLRWHQVECGMCHACGPRAYVRDGDDDDAAMRAAKFWNDAGKAGRGEP